MFNKKFLVPILALAAFGMTASASVVTYCAGTGCSPENAAAFMSDLSSDSVVLQSQETFVASGLSGSIYTDQTTGIQFEDYAGSSLSISGTSLTTPTQSSALAETIEILIPASIIGLELTVNVPSGLCVNSICPANETSGFVGFIDPNATDPWTVFIQAASQSNYTEILNFTATGAQVQESPTPEVGTLLLIGFGLLAMRWMRRLPRRFFPVPQAA